MAPNESKKSKTTPAKKKKGLKKRTSRASSASSPFAPKPKTDTIEVGVTGVSGTDLANLRCTYPGKPNHFAFIWPIKTYFETTEGTTMANNLNLDQFISCPDSDGKPLPSSSTSSYDGKQFVCYLPNNNTPEGRLELVNNFVKALNKIVRFPTVANDYLRTPVFVVGRDNTDDFDESTTLDKFYLLEDIPSVVRLLYDDDVTTEDFVGDEDLMKKCYSDKKDIESFSL